MKLRESVICLLLRAYPAVWRREFGAELEEVLQHSQLRTAVIVNVIAGAFGERVLNLIRRITKGDEMADQTFGAHHDRMTQIISGSVVVVLVAVPLMAMRSGMVAVALALISVAVIALAYAYSPRSFEISDGKFRVKRLIGDVVFPFTSLRFVRDANPSDFRGCVRLWGSGGLFGYYGLFWSKALGKSRWYVTDRSKAVVVTDGSETMLVSPEDHDGFVAAIERAGTQMLSPIAKSASDGLACSLTESANTGLVFVRIVGFAIAGLVLAIVAAALLYAPGRPPVELTGDALVIHSRFYGMTVAASSVDVAHVRVVDLRTETGWKTTMRTNGFGNPHYRAGEFKTANGRTVKLFTTGSERLVLLPPSGKDGLPVLLDVDEPDQFAARIRQEWSIQ
jgi:hypothetical protein